jgi:acyl carrier protein
LCFFVNFSILSRGCFHTSSSLAAEYAYKNGIPVVVGATLSRGQIIENKVLIALQQKITEAEAMEKEIKNLQMNAPKIDNTIFDLIDINKVTEGKVHEKVTFVDFYRYFGVKNHEMITYLNNKNSYWKKRKNFAIYSTNCPIKQLGDYGHLKEKGFHYYGSATCWEKRIGHLELANIQEDLSCKPTRKGYENFLKRIGYKQKESSKIRIGEKYLCAYFVPDKSAESKNLLHLDLRDYMNSEVPLYMIPEYFIQLEQIPLTSNGKIDNRALPLPKPSQSKSSATYMAPGTEMEKTISDIWKEVLGVERVGLRDNFFDLGGNSLNIIVAGNKLKDITKTEIPVVTLFTYPTVSSLVTFLNQQKRNQTTTKNEPDRNKIIDKGREQLLKRRGRHSGT